ncbi:hemolysin family protein [Actinopolymorpha alba]|uniref:hemolysin family protein n=1 Tax=Actinopolymorpha alba TaxID=533267 RepID=UPI0003787A4A|nr:hemolysin family protein [Actinopolymorpha alba]
MGWEMVILFTVALLVASGFFVASEFALIGARRHRLEQAAQAGRRGAASAVKSIRELSLMLAGAQFGITMCMIGLGMVSKPALHHFLEGPLMAVGLPSVTADVAALIIALVVVTYLHVVIGEMAPKSWVIAHPERSAMLLAPAFRVFTWTVRPIIAVLNRASNALLRLFRITPRDEIVNVRNREQIHHLVEESRRLDLLSEDDYGLLTRTLDAPAATIERVMVPADRIVSVPTTATPQDVIDTANASGRTRVLVRAADGSVAGVVHVRDALVARQRGSGWRASTMATPVPVLAPDTDLAEAVSCLQERRAQLGVVRTTSGALVGLVSLDDLLGQIMSSQAA